MKDFGSALLAIFGGVISLAIVSVLVSQKAQTGSVIGAGGNALANVITAAVAPVTGASASVQTGSSSSTSINGILDQAGGLLGNLGSFGL